MASKMTDRVRLRSGEVAVIGDLLDAGRATVSKVDNFAAPRSEAGVRTAYFADFEGGGCIEIGKFAYLSRTGQDVTP